MGWIAFIYGLTVLFTGVPSMLRGEIWLGLAGTFAPLLAEIAGAGITASRKMPDAPIAGAIGVGTILMAIALYWVHHAGWHVKFGIVDMSGFSWCLVGGAIGLLWGLTYSE